MLNNQRDGIPWKVHGLFSRRVFKATDFLGRHVWTRLVPLIHPTPPKKQTNIYYGQRSVFFSGHLRKLLKRRCSREWGIRDSETGAHGLKTSSLEQYLWVLWMIVFWKGNFYPFFWLGFKPPTVLVPIMILLFGCFFPTQVRYFGVHLRMLDVNMSSLASFVIPATPSDRPCVLRWVNAGSDWRIWRLPNFGNFFAKKTPTPSGKPSCPTLGKGFWKGMSSLYTPVTWGIPLVRGSGELL